jgi:hypothetical protein
VITTEHLNRALDLAESYGLSATHIRRLEIKAGRLVAIRVSAPCPQLPKLIFMGRLTCPKPQSMIAPFKRHRASP